MKQNDIFEKKVGRHFVQFQIVELNADKLKIQTLDTTPIIFRSENISGLVADYDAALSLGANGEYETTDYSDSLIDYLANSICEEIKARRNALLWLTSCKDMNRNEAEMMINDIADKISGYCVKYLMAVVRWAGNGEIDITKEADIYKARKLLSKHVRSLLVKHKGNGDTLAFDGICFKRLSVGRPASCLWTMKEVEQFLRYLEEK